MRNETKQSYAIFSPWLRVFHWTMVICVIILFATGLYIGDPAFRATPGSAEPTIAVGGWLSMESIRRLHFCAAFVLIAAFIFRIYGAVRYRGDRLLPRFHKQSYWHNLGDTVKHYLFIPQEHERPVLRNSLARTAYLFVYILFFFEILTGLAMFVMIFPNSVAASLLNPINLLFSEYQVHVIHHYIAWIFILFVIPHVYMAFRADFMEGNGEVSSMISGKKYFAEDPSDLGDIKHD